MAGGCSGRRSASNDELLFRVMEYERLLSLRQREKPPHVVLNKWVMNNNRSRKIVLHKLRADFGPDGEVSRRTDRESQHSRIAFLTCPGKHAAVQESRHSMYPDFRSTHHTAPSSQQQARQRAIIQNERSPRGLTLNDSLKRRLWVPRPPPSALASNHNSQ